LKTVEIFSGTKSFSKVAASRGHTIFTVDNNPKLCKNNSTECNHQRAPRGSKTGTQGLTQIDRGAVHEELIKEILELTECALQERNLM